MMEHSIEKHTKKKGKDNQFYCDDCSFKCKKRQQLLTHFRNEHKQNPGEEVNPFGDRNEVTNNVEEENRQLKNNSERLNTMFQESL